METKENNIALVTEAGNGLGKSFANILLEQNYKVILAVCGEGFKLLSEDGDPARGYELIEVDFTSDNMLIQLYNTIKSSGGKLDLLVNNAEIVNGFGQKIDQIDLDEVRKLYEVNLFAVIRIVQVLKPLLEESKSPKIINITSALGDINKMKEEEFCYANYCLTAYATSKAALNMFTQLQCKEFKPSKIKIHSFDPVARENCTYNSVVISEDVKNAFISLIEDDKS